MLPVLRFKGLIVLGLILYTFLAVGHGGLLPPLRLGRFPSFGAAILSGYALTLLLMFLLHVILRVPLTLTVYSILFIAGAGWLKAYSRIFNRRTLGGPASVFFVMTIVAVVVKGGVDYLPYTVDEFTNWIGVSREIYLHGGYEAIRETVHLPGYLPGWRLMLLLPWVVVGHIDMGLSTMAPLILHIGLATLVFEIFRFEGERHRGFPQKNVVIWAWGLILLYLTAEGTGKLWAFNLLIEQPQIYILTAFFVYLYLLDDPEIKDTNVFFHGGLAISAGYMIKAATLTVLPGLFLVLLILFFREPDGDKLSRVVAAIQNSIKLLLPVVAIVVLWKGAVPETGKNCLSDPLLTLTPDVIFNISKLDWQALLERFIAAVLDYVITYKSMVLIVAASGVIVTLVKRSYLWFFSFLTFAFVYFLSLYWFHLTCFGPYHFENLNSIPRFTRVVVQPLHAMGLIALAIFWIGFVARNSLIAMYLSKPARTPLLVGCLALLSWQGYQLYVTANDLTTRQNQNVDPRIAEVRAARAFVKREFSESQKPPLIQFISQGTDGDLLGYARMYALDGTPGNPRTLFHFAPQVSWSPGDPSNIWQTTENKKGLTKTLNKADIIWPIFVDGFVKNALQNLALSGDCGGKLTDYVLIKNLRAEFLCRQKSRVAMHGSY